MGKKYHSEESVKHFQQLFVPGGKEVLLNAGLVGNAPSDTARHVSKTISRGLQLIREGHEEIQHPVSIRSTSRSAERGCLSKLINRSSGLPLVLNLFNKLTVYLYNLLYTYRAYTREK